MTCNWELNGRELGTSANPVAVTAYSGSTQVRQSFTAIGSGGEDRQRLGKDLHRVTVEFTVLGTGSAKHGIVEDILDVVEDDEVWTLQSPTDNDNIYVYKEYRRAAFSTQQVRVEVVNRVKVVVRVEAILNGVWVVDGGSYCQSLKGYFTLTSTGPNSFTRDDGTVTGTTPLLRVVEQLGGYPLGIRASDFAEVPVPGPSSTLTVTGLSGETITYQDYDLTGFLVSAPSTAGDVGLYEVCSSPTAAVLDATVVTNALLTEDGHYLTTEAGDVIQYEV